MAMFDEYYSRIVTCLEDYLRGKNESGWSPQVKIFKDTILPPIAESKNCVRLYKETELFSNGLYTRLNVVTLGLIRGSQLKQNLEKILSDMIVASDTAEIASLEAAPAQVITSPKEAASTSDEAPPLPPRPVLASPPEPAADTSTDLSKIPLVILVPKLMPQRKQLLKKTAS